jgi:hypothetical protein
MKVAPFRSRVRLRLGLAAAVVVIGAAVTSGLVPSRGSGQPPQAAQLVSIQGGCEQWLGSNPGQPGNRRWCTDMGSWTTKHMSSYHVGPQMMWGGPDRMLATCEDWMTASPPSGAATTPTEWCTAMVRWMTSHPGSWSGQASWGGWMNGTMGDT